jgi:hypothetical protein
LFFRSIAAAAFILARWTSENPPELAAQSLPGFLLRAEMTDSENAELNDEKQAMAEPRIHANLGVSQKRPLWVTSKPAT